MDDLQSNLTKAEEKVEEQKFSDRFPQVKQDFQAAQVSILKLHSLKDERFVYKKALC